MPLEEYLPFLHYAYVFYLFSAYQAIYAYVRHRHHHLAVTFFLSALTLAREMIFTPIQA